MPELWRSKGEVCIREVSDAEMDQLVAEDGGGQADDGKNDDSVVDGYYHEGGSDRDEGPTITLRKSMPEAEAAFVFTHEYGHFVWYTKLTRQQRAEYGNLWRQVKRTGSLVTKYAADSEEEGFAETFAHYLRKPNRLQDRDSRSYRFLQNMELASLQKANSDRRSHHI
jgi:hypothetical protein